MRYRLLKNILLSVLILSIASCAAGGNQTLNNNSRIIVYYTHGSFRCQSCRDIENNTKETLDKYYKDELQSGTIVFQPLNRSLEKNEKFISDYKITYNTVVIIKTNGSIIEKWKRFDKCWDYLNDKPAFMKHLKNSIDEYLHQ